MPTHELITRLLDAADATPATDTIEVLHELLDDSMIEAVSAPVRISDAAALTGLSAYTLRYYESKGLVHPRHNMAGYREYSAFDLRRIVFIARMRLSGMTMADLQRYIGLVEQGDTTMPQRRALMIAQRERIERQMRELSLALGTTNYKIKTYTPEMTSD
ncbi:MerR family transcriptional regulator [Bifidobacterium tibiigranuli]|jgi:DNA-binding transcriptional MerR regulator|uniref:MerR family transcriptional regulator n=1 Tax=Bifidobacterium tibiigranuli TaxID=2172043 RepID=UPI0026E96C8B|nr:MerR family transcriptional regulator [Bifidobacterium tibiigranuli]MCI1712135.1 MerR family transcriptional regulator [Bifidobacterium tibiigranuli]MCI1834247.1 MerR family transcriptional regulator [Bifidobacterium tibiigranuli]